MTKITLAVFLVLLSLTVNAQSKGNNHAIFSECAKEESPSDCTDEKFTNAITGLISTEITKELKSTTANNYFFISLAFLSDENGKVIPETLEIASENKALESAIKEYILNLPPFIPKDESNEERRSVHTESYTFIYNNHIQKYEAATKERLLEEGITPVYVALGNEPVLKKCTDDDKEEAKKCTRQMLYEHISKKISLRSIDEYFTGQIKLLASFIIEKDGSITIKEITCTLDNCEGLINEYRKAFKSLPKFIPGDYRGVKVRVAYNLPVTINIK